MSEPGEGSRDIAAVRAASRFARPRHQTAGPPKRGKSGSLVLTALIVIAVLVGMLWLMLSLN